MQKTKKILCFFILALCSILLYNCEQQQSCPPCEYPPDPVFIKIVDSLNTDLIYTQVYHSDSIQIYFFINNTRYDLFTGVHFDSVKKQANIYAHDIGLQSSYGTKKFYLVLDSLNTDTIYINFQRKKISCCTNYVLNDFTINDQQVEYDSISGFYIFQK